MYATALPARGPRSFRRVAACSRRAPCANPANVRRSLGPIVALLVGGLVLAGAGCGPSNDLGSSCTVEEPVLDTSTNKVKYVPYPKDQMSPTSDYISTGGTDCEDFTCIDTAGDGKGAYCSRRCIDDASCQGGVDKTLVCRTLVLDDAFINELRQSLGDQAFQQLFGDIQTAKYCAHPIAK